MKTGAKVVFLGDKGEKIAGTFRQHLGRNEEQTVILLGAPQADGAMTIIVPSDKVEEIVVKKSAAKKKKAAKEKEKSK